MTIGELLARRIFAARGNHSEAHLSERELAEIVDAGIGLHAKAIETSSELLSGTLPCSDRNCKACFG